LSERSERDGRRERSEHQPSLQRTHLARRLVVRGRVQGVWYRDSTRREAERHGVAGSARNRPDGTVEVMLEGPPDAVAAVEAFCRQGPRHAHVTAVEAVDVEPQGRQRFEIR
jgi:acylphosphatase